MEFIGIHTVQHLGIAIIHSLWQIGIVTFIYFYFLLSIKKLSVNQKYTAGLICFAIVLVSFTVTFQSVKNQKNLELFTSSENVVNNTSEGLQVSNWQGEELSEAGENSKFFTLNFHKYRTLLNQVAGVIGIIWILGLLFLVFSKIQAYFTLKRIKNNKCNVRSIKWGNTLKEISATLNLKKHVDVLFSPFVNSPLSFGFLKPVILFPLRLTTGLSNEEIKCILIHELAHNLRNDYLYNIFQNVIEVLFFYHPGIWWMSKNIRTQREIICDKIVLDNRISEKYYINTLIKLSELQVRDSNIAIAAKRTENELFTRIKYIIGKSDTSRKRKGNPLIIVGFVLIFIISGFVYQGKENIIKSTGLIEEIGIDLSSFDGAFAFYDLKQDKYYISNDSLCNKRYPAYSTFKITSSLIALDMGIANNEFYTIDYDSVKYPLPNWMKENTFFKNWYREHNIKSALYYSVNWYFKELGVRIGNDNMKNYLDKLDYGNKKITTDTDPSWYTGQLKISATEQVEFLKNILKQESKDLSVEAQVLTKKAIPCAIESNYSIYGKTGTGKVAYNRFIGWYVGYLETKGNSYAFALNIFADSMDEIPGKMRQELVKDIFTDLGYLDK